MHACAPARRAVAGGAMCPLNMPGCLACVKAGALSAAALGSSCRRCAHGAGACTHAIIGCLSHAQAGVC